MKTQKHPVAYKYLDRLRLSLVVALLVIGLLPALPSAAEEPPGRHIPQELLIGMPLGASVSNRAAIHKTRGARLIKHFEAIGVDVVRLPSGRSLNAARSSYLSVRGVRFAEFNYLLQPYLDQPDDEYFQYQWALRNVGQTIAPPGQTPDAGTPDADIDAYQDGVSDAWSVTTGSSPGPVVAVIDTGIDSSHPDLAANVWTNPGETDGNGIDDDGNGYVDDFRGWDFANGDNSVYDQNETCAGGRRNDDHGTHIAGIIGAVRNVGGGAKTGIVGINWQVRIMSLKFIRPQLGGCTGDTSDAIEAILYAVNNGADFINASWGGSEKSEALRQAIISAGQSGILFVSAAGDGGVDGVGDDLSSALNEEYPAEFDLANMIVVASSDNDDQMSSFSNFGGPVDVAAPGELILSTITSTGNPDPYAFFDGTSMAAPHVTGALALLRSQYPQAPPSELKNRIIATVDVKPAFENTQSGGRLNLNEALRLDVPVVIPTVTYPNGGSTEVLTTGTSQTITWSTNVPTGNPVRTYQVEYTTNATASAPFTSDFEGDLLPSEFVEPTDSEAPWLPQDTTPRPGGPGGTKSAKSGTIGDNQASWMSLTTTLASPGTVSFWYMTASENCESPQAPVCGDYLHFLLDGVRLLKDSENETGANGVTPWTRFTTSIPAGDHTFSWAYQKNEMCPDVVNPCLGTPAEDAVWIDDLEITGVDNVSWSIITPTPTSAGASSHSWTVPNVGTAVAKVRVCLAPGTPGPCAASEADVSDATFTITSPTPGFSLSDSPVLVTEGGNSDSYSLALTKQPSSDVIVNISHDGQITTSVSELTFTSSNWYVPQGVTVTAVDDADSEGPHTSILAHSVDPSSDAAYQGLSPPQVTVNVVDNDGPPPAPPASWESLGGILTSGPAVSSWAVNRLDVFARGTGNSLIHKWWDGASWSEWETQSGGIAGDPAAVSWGFNRIDVFARSSSDELLHKWWDGSSWSVWESLGGVLASEPTVSSWDANRLDVFVRGIDDRLWHKWWNGSYWADWEPLGGELASDPAAVSWDINRIDVFVRGIDDRLWHRWWNGSSWSVGWEPLGGVLASSPAASSWGFNRLDVFVEGSGDVLLHKYWSGSSWSDWETTPGAIASKPAAVSWAFNRIDLFTRGTDNSLWHKWWDGSAWRP